MQIYKLPSHGSFPEDSFISLASSSLASDMNIYIFKKSVNLATQSRSQIPRSSVGGIVGLWENAAENQPLIGFLIISLTHSLLIEIRAILIIQRSKIQNLFTSQLFKASLYITPTQYETIHSQALYKLHNRKIYAQQNYTMEITCRHATICS